MRILFAILLVLGSCAQKEEREQFLSTGTFAGEGRDRLCIAGEPGSYRGGLIIYGGGDVNCSATGRIDMKDGQIALVPRGDTTCRIPLAVQSNSVRIGDVGAACAYYCGPGASMAGKAFNRSDMGSTAVDLVGDPLC